MRLDLPPSAAPTPLPKPAALWQVPARINARTLGIAIALLILLGWSSHRVTLDRAATLLAESVAAVFRPGQTTQVGRGLHRLADLFPPQLAEETAVSRIQNFDRRRLPWLGRIERRTEKEVRVNPATLQTETVATSREMLVEPLGYLRRVLVLMLETLEMGVWGTLLAILISVPLAIFSARNYAPHPVAYSLARALVAFFRAIPEMLSALFLVLAFGFGPVAGIFALAVHGAGFLGKFYAEDIENAAKGPQEALRCLGISRLKILWFAVLPQAWPQYIAYTLYILDRNIRMATVIGIVGAGGIGQELIGRYEMFEYGRVGTILIVLFATVLLLDQLAAKLRLRLL